jgi:magnesium-transporting ATPase (P-type)
MLFRGTLVMEGRGRAVVVATGGDTILGKYDRTGLNLSLTFAS